MKYVLRRTIFKLLIVIFIAAGVFAVFFAGAQIFAKRSFTVEDEVGFIKAMRHSAEQKKNVEYSVVKSFELSADALPDGLDFYGTLDGNGHTITVKGDTLKKPIFNALKKGSAVKRLNVVAKSTVGSDGENIAVLATQNEGTVENCALTVDRIYIGTNCKNAAGLVTFNTNTISNVLIDVKSVDYDVTLVNWQCRFGSVAAVNYAQVKNVFADVSFEKHAEQLKQPLFDNEKPNGFIGYVFGAMPENDGSGNISDVYFFNGDYVCRSVDEAVITLKNYKDINSDLLGKKWSADVWRLSKDGEFPELRVHE